MKPLIDNSSQFTSCPACGKNYQKAPSVLLDADVDRTVFHITCSSCSTAALVFVNMGQFGAISMGMLTDLSADEARRLFHGEPITADQVLEVYKYLHNI